MGAPKGKVPADLTLDMNCTLSVRSHRLPFDLEDPNIVRTISYHVVTDYRTVVRAMRGAPTDLDAKTMSLKIYFSNQKSPMLTHITKHSTVKCY